MEQKTKIQHCKKCLMPNTRPGSIFDKEGICQACRNYEKRKTINWEERKKELKKLCDKYRRTDGYYDCIVPVSGGKDSHTLVYRMKEEMGMNPLLITVGNPYTSTKAGASNFRNIGDVFGCDHILFNMSTDMLRRVDRICFEEFGEPLRFVETACYTFVYKMAVQLGIPLVMFGEDPEYEYGTTDKNRSIANAYISGGLAYGIFRTIDIDFWGQKGIARKELNAFIPPSREEVEKIKPEIVFMSYYTPWSSTKNLEIARRFGFTDLAHEWKREGCIEDFEQIDSIAYLVHLWLKYPKFGFQRVSDIASRRVREGLLSLPEAKKLIMEHDYKLDQLAMKDFINFLGYTPKQFWDIVDKFWNHDLFEKVDGVWKPKFNYDE